MPPYDYQPDDLQIQTIDGETIPSVSAQDISDWDLGPGGYSTTSFYLIRGDDAIELCGTIRMPSVVRKRLSRKRIKKLLMSFGVPRNMAERESRKTVRILDMPFRSALICLLSLKVWEE